MKVRLFIAVTIIVLTGCQTCRNVSIQSDNNTDFKKYKTFAWVAEQDTARQRTDVIRNNAKNFVIHCMSQRGLLFDTENPDLLLDLIVSGEYQQSVFTTPITHYSPDYYLNNPNYYPYYYPVWSDFTYDFKGEESIEIQHVLDTVKYVEETITLRVIDRRKNKTVWTGTTAGNIYDTDYLSHDTHPGVHRLMNQFPVKPLKTIDKKSLNRFPLTPKNYKP